MRARMPRSRGEIYGTRLGAPFQVPGLVFRVAGARCGTPQRLAQSSDEYSPSFAGAGKNAGELTDPMAAFEITTSGVTMPVPLR